MGPRIPKNFRPKKFPVRNFPMQIFIIMTNKSGQEVSRIEVEQDTPINEAFAKFLNGLTICPGDKFEVVTSTLSSITKG